MLTISYPTEFDIEHLNDVAKEFTTNSMASMVRNPFVGGGSDVPEYRGSTDITPTEHRQVLATSGKRINSNVIIEPIPELWKGYI